MALLAGAFLLGCGGGGGAEEDVAAGDGAETAAETPEAGPVEVVLDEYTIRMPRSIRTGEAVEIRNVGFETHNLRLRLPGTDSLIWSTTEDLDPGESVEVRFDLSPGDYSVVCDFAGHGSRGMRTDVTIESAPGGTPPGEGTPGG